MVSLTVLGLRLRSVRAVPAPHHHHRRGRKSVRVHRLEGDVRVARIPGPAERSGQTGLVTRGPDAAAGDAIRIVGIEAMTTGWVEQVIELGDKHRNRLGRLPFAGFHAAAGAHNIVLAVRTHADDTEDLAGYCLYDPTVRADRYARIAHLCVAEDARGQGIAARLVEEVMDRCGDRQGLRLKCRNDWEAAHLWPSLGFEPVRSRTGRGKTKEPMTEWVRHNDSATNLLSLPIEDPDRLLAGVDNNVFCDLYGASNHDANSSRAASRSSQPRSRFVSLGPFSLTNELNQTVDQRERDRLLQTAHVGGMKTLNGDRTKIRALRDRLLAAVPDHIREKDDSLKMDATLLAESIIGGADVFVTRDRNVVTYMGPTAAEGRDFAVLFPDELAAFIDRRADAASYLPSPTRADRVHHQPRRRRDLEPGEPLRPTQQRLRRAEGQLPLLIKSLAEQTAGTDDRQMMRTPSGDTLAIWAAQDNGTSLEVPMLRIQRGPLLPTIARQMSRTLRRRAAESGLTTVRLTDQHLPATIAAELRRDGFTDATGILTATVLTTVGTWKDVRTAYQALPAAGLVLPAQLTSVSEATDTNESCGQPRSCSPRFPPTSFPSAACSPTTSLGTYPPSSPAPATSACPESTSTTRAGSQPSAPGRILWYSSARDQEVSPALAWSRASSVPRSTPP